MRLLLLDVDGTLFLTDDPLFGRAATAAVNEVYGVRLTPRALREVGHPGQTALRIGRDLLRAAGLDDRRIDGRLGQWCERANAAYLELLADADTSGWRAAPGAVEVLAALQTLARTVLLTGNPEGMARARMQRLGLDGFFPAGQGAFGCDEESRPALIGRALERAGVGPAEAVAIGDTPVDIAGAREAGIRVVAVASGRFDPAHLAGADAVISSLRELPAALAELPA